MQNLSISCSLVCLIILSTAVLIGFFGLCRHQISAVLVTGVMYLLAGKFINDDQRVSKNTADRIVVTIIALTEQTSSVQRTVVAVDKLGDRKDF